MAPTDVYREVGNDEFRGKGYFYATFAKDTRIETHPKAWGAQAEAGERVIVQPVARDWLGRRIYRIWAVWRRGRWADPLGAWDAEKYHYRVRANALRDIEPRLVGGE